MYNTQQLVKIKWNNTNRLWFESKGYQYTKRYDIFYVKAKDLNPKSNEKIECICDVCNTKYVSRYQTIHDQIEKYNKTLCWECAVMYGNETRRLKEAEQKFQKAQDLCEKFGYCLVTNKEEYTDSHMKIKILIPSYGEYDVYLDNFINGHKPFIDSYKNRNLNRLDISIVQNKILQRGCKLTNPSQYINTITRNLKIQCQCGNIFTTSFRNFYSIGIDRCPKCSRSESKGQKAIQKYLTDKNIVFERQKRFDDCRDIKPLPFDFYLSELNTIIEFDGNQHNEPIFGIESLKNTQRHDKIKNEYCIQKNINLIRIPQKDFSNINVILNKKLLQM